MSKPNISIAVMGIPIRKKEKNIEYLLSLRHQPEKPLWHNKWQQIGGGLEWGETPEQALSREFEEEAGISCQILWPHPIIKTSIWQAKDNDVNHEAHVLLLSYIVDIGKQVPNCEGDDETAKISWYSLSEAMKLDALPNLKEFLLETEEIVKREIPAFTGMT